MTPDQAPRPVVGIICCHRSVGAETAQAVMNRYCIAAMRDADVSVLLIPSLPGCATASDIMDRLDGLLLTGSPSNVQPHHYGETAEGDGPFDPERDSMMLRMVEAAVARSKPVFGICRGFQELNVAFGGSLRRDVNEDAFKHHAPADVPFNDMFEHRHSVSLTPHGVLANALGRQTLEVSSVHYQGIKNLAPNLTCEATAPDGLIEAFSGTINQSPILAVQWHPEWDAARNPESAALFQMFGRAVRGLH